MKIAIMAGTPIDSQLGEDLLKKYGYKDIVKIPISKNPVEQTTFQALDDSEREDIIVEIINKIKEQQCSANEINIITPMQMYRNLGLEYKYLAVMAANSHGLTGVENNLYLSNPELKVFGLSMLELVKAIEDKNSPDKIVADFDFENLFKYFEQTEVEAVVLGCTHFPYIKEELEKITELPIIDVGVFMINSNEVILSKYIELLHFLF